MPIAAADWTILIGTATARTAFWFKFAAISVAVNFLVEVVFEATLTTEFPVMNFVFVFIAMKNERFAALDPALLLDEAELTNLTLFPSAVSMDAIQNQILFVRDGHGKP